MMGQQRLTPFKARNVAFFCMNAAQETTLCLVNVLIVSKVKTPGKSKFTVVYIRLY